MDKLRNSVPGRLILSACLLSCALTAWSKGLFYSCHKAATPPKIDGILDESDWQSAERIEFAEIQTGTLPDLASSAKALWDAECLYLAFSFEDKKVWARIKENDIPALPDFKGYTENFAKVYLDPDCDGMNYTEMHFSPSGAVNDKWQNAPWRPGARKACGVPDDVKPAAHWEWNCEGMRSAVAVQGTLNNPADADTGWTLEVAIPFASLKRLSATSAFPPEANDKWKAHLGRRYRPEESDASAATYWTWPVIGIRDCHNPDRWGYLVFVNSGLPKISEKEALGFEGDKKSNK